MKTLLISIFLTLAFASFCRAQNSVGTDMALRQVLADDPGIEAVYAIDRTHSFVIGRSASLEENMDFRVLGRYSEGPAHAQEALMIEHGEEPMIYKSAAPGSLDRIRSGALRLSRSPLSPGKEGYSSLDIFEMATLSCQGGGGDAIYVVPKKYGRFKRLTEVGALEAFRYILQKGSTSVWVVACNGTGAARFQVVKNYDFVNDGEEVAEFRPGLVLDDVNYVRDERAEAARLTNLQRKRYGGAPSLEDTVREIAALKRGFVKNISGKRYYGSFRGYDRGRCADVSLRRLDVSDDEKVTVLREYKVCSGKVSLLGLTETAEVLPDGKGMYYSSGGIKVANSD